MSRATATVYVGRSMSGCVHSFGVGRDRIVFLLLCSGLVGCVYIVSALVYGC